MRLLPNLRNLPAGLAGFVEKRPLVCLIIVVLYVVSPVDILPEALLGPLGVFDDALVGIAALSLLKRAAKARLALRATRTAQAASASVPRLAEPQRPSGRQNEQRDRERHRREDRRFPDRRRDDRRR